MNLSQLPTGGDANGLQCLFKFWTDSMEAGHGKILENLFHLFFLDDDQTIRFLQTASQFCKELIRGHPNGTGQSFFLSDSLFGQLGDMKGRFEKELRLSDVKIGFIIRGTSHETRST